MRESDEAEAAGAIEVEELGEHFGVEGADVHEKDVGDVAFVKSLGKLAVIKDVGAGGGKIGAFELGDCGGVGFGHATGVGFVPEIIAEAHGDGGDFVAALGEEGADGVVFGGGVAFGEVGEAEPVPVVGAGWLAGGQFEEQRFVAGDVGFEVCEGILVEIHVGPGVIAERIAGVAPGLEDGEIVRFFFEDGGVDEAVDGREMSGVERGESFVGDFEASFTGRKRAVGGEIVEGEGDLKSGGSGGKGIGEGESCGGDDGE